MAEVYQAEVYQLFSHPLLVVGFKLPWKLWSCFPPGITGPGTLSLGQLGRGAGVPQRPHWEEGERAAGPCEALPGAPTHEMVSCLYEQYPKLTEALCLSRNSVYSCACLCGNIHHGSFHPSVSTGGLGNLKPDLLTQPSFVGAEFPSPWGRTGRKLLVSMNSASLPHQTPLCCVTVKGDNLAPND